MMKTSPPAENTCKRTFKGVRKLFILQPESKDFSSALETFPIKSTFASAGPVIAEQII
jgi:hypothetical protein